MPYSVSATDPAVSTGELLPLLVLHSDKRDRALGLPRPGARTMSLLDFRRRQQGRAVSKLATAAFYKALIDECRAEARRLIDEADTPEKRCVILPDVERLNEMAERAAAAISQLVE